MCSLCPNSISPREVMRKNMNRKWKILSVSNAFHTLKQFKSITCLLLTGQHNIKKIPLHNWPSMLNGTFCTNITQSLMELLAVHGNCRSWPYPSKLVLPIPTPQGQQPIKNNNKSYSFFSSISALPTDPAKPIIMQWTCQVLNKCFRYRYKSSLITVIYFLKIACLQ